MPIKVFVAHPYKTIPIEDYRASFKELQKDLTGCKFVFADEEITSQHILERIRRMILDADVSLFDITTWNANVTLELGLAIGLNRQYYILFDPTKGEKEVPSDIRGWGRIEYTSLAQLRSILTVALQRHLKQAGSEASEEYEALKDRVRECLVGDKRLSMQEIATQLGVNQSVVTAIVNEMRSAEELIMHGQRKGAKYSLT